MKCCLQVSKLKSDGSAHSDPQDGSTPDSERRSEALEQREAHQSKTRLTSSTSSDDSVRSKIRHGSAQVNQAPSRARQSEYDAHGVRKLDR